MRSSSVCFTGAGVCAGAAEATAGTIKKAARRRERTRVIYLILPHLLSHHAAPIDGREELWILAPIRFHLHERLEKNFLLESLFHFVAGDGSYLLQSSPARANQDRFLPG